MAKAKISEWSATAGNNTEIDGVSLGEGVMTPSQVNNAIRELMSQVAELYAGSSGDAWSIAAGGTGVAASSVGAVRAALGITDASLSTETTSGIMRIATAAEMAAGTLDNVALTPKKAAEWAPASATIDTVADELLIRDATDSKIKRAAFPVAARFSAWKNGTDQTGILSATYTKVTFGTEYFDIGGYYDASNSRFTPPAGYYHFTATVYHTANIVDGQEYIAAIYKNGVSVLEFSLRAPSTGGQLAAVFGTLQANGTDYFEVYTYGGGAGNKTAAGGIYTRFEAFAV